jgi:small subunit ribosomal protein SAe
MLIRFVVCPLQVDLFFYRDPEEAKEQEEEAAGAPEYAAITDYAAAGQWGGDQWTSDVTAPPPVAGGDWPLAEGLHCSSLIKVHCLL